MADAGLDVSGLASKMKISYQAVRKAVQGGQFSAENNAKAAKLLKVSSDWLAIGEGQRARGVPVVAQGVQSLDEGDRKLLDDFHELLDDEQATLAREIAARAAKMRVHNAKLLQMASSATERKAVADVPPLAPHEKFTTADHGHMPQLQHFGPPGAAPKGLRKKD